MPKRRPQPPRGRPDRRRRARPAASSRRGSPRPGFEVVCLEQGDWPDRAEYRGPELDWELSQRKQWSTSPNVRGLPAATTRSTRRTPRSAADVHRRSAARCDLRRRLAADAAVRLPRPLARRHRRRLAARPTRSCGRTTSAPTASSAFPGWAATRPTRPAARTRRCRRCRIGPGGIEVARAHDRARLALVAGANSILSAPYDGRHAVRRSAAPACRAAPRAPRRRPTSPTGRRRSRAGARLITGARVRAAGDQRAGGLVTGATWIDRDGARALRAGRGRRAGRERHRHAAAAAALGVRRAPRRPGQLAAASSGGG